MSAAAKLLPALWAHGPVIKPSMITCCACACRCTDRGPAEAAGGHGRGARCVPQPHHRGLHAATLRQRWGGVAHMPLPVLACTARCRGEDHIIGHCHDLDVGADTCHSVAKHSVLGGTLLTLMHACECMGQEPPSCRWRSRRNSECMMVLACRQRRVLPPQWRAVRDGHQRRGPR